MCQYCDGTHSKEISVNESPNDKNTQINSALIVHLPTDDKPGIVLLRHGIAQGVFDINYCPMCGRKIR